jgi:heat shock protein HtpX
VVAIPVLFVAIFLVPVFVAVVLAVVVGAAVTMLRVRGVDARLASAMGAQPLADGARPRLESVTESVAMAVGVSPPELYVIDSPSLNAVAWGGGSGPARCAFTTGLLDSMDRVQLEAVVGHQLAVVRNGGLGVVTVGTALLGPIAKGPLEAAVASFVHRTVRARSVVVADLEGARATRYPPGLVAALERVRDGSTDVPAVPPTLSVLCFAAPDDRPGPFLVHPPIEDRIDLLREI